MLVSTSLVSQFLIIYDVRSSLKAGLELKADGLTNTFLHSEWAVIVNSQIFNVSMTIRRAGETLR